MPADPTPPVALVTGSSRGIGRAIALRLATDGYRVIVNGRHPDPVETASGAYEVKARVEAAGGRAIVCGGDVGTADGRGALIACVGDLGRLDLLVNNAGVAPAERRDLLRMDEGSYDRVMGVNLRGPLFLTRALARRMVEWRRAGVVDVPRIAFITSVSAYASSTSRGEYCISKAGLSMAARLFADRLAADGIPVVEVRPGIIRTDMTAGVTDRYDSMIADGLLPTRRWGTPDDVARVVAAFARGDLDYSTGQCIEVGGGFGLRRL